MKDALVIIFTSIGIASLWEPIYQLFLSELDKVNQGKGSRISLGFWAKRMIVSLLMFLSAYIVANISLATTHTIVAIMLGIAFINVVLGAYILRLDMVLLWNKSKNK